MTAPPEDRGQVAPYVALVRIGTVVAMSTAAALGIFLIVGGWWPVGLLVLLAAVPLFVLMRLVERTAQGREEEPPT